MGSRPGHRPDGSTPSASVPWARSPRSPSRPWCGPSGGARGHQLAALARAHDPGPVVPDRPAKSVGHEETFPTDIDDPAVLGRTAARHAEAVASHLRKAGLAGRTVTVKVRFADFSTIIRSHTLTFAVDTAPALAAVARALLESVDVSPGVRLLGVSASGLRPRGGGRQLAFDFAGEGPPDPPNPGGDDPGVPGAGAAGPADRRAARLQDSWHDLSAAVDAIRGRFGTDSVGAASMVSEHGITVPAQRTQPWGPPDEERQPPGGRADPNAVLSRTSAASDRGDAGPPAAGHREPVLRAG